ncbi:class I SAM-dependent methyltransferase [Paenibacillus piri]|uniref:Class I SAM-dependent methyltransferase n=1 Tax=Paenibacillus piri TaxID=2547395 RepID=A0A4V2ZTA0_9BACL|nr:class I SAM-dependent methyltransferase [Paenibacillus piri]TDF96284.1 class I SAM-dependent methyltransferase [Paenibacillus piri]
MSEQVHRFSPENMHRLDAPERQKLMPSKQLLDMVLQTQDTVVDLGAGTGYFSIPAAQMTNGTVYAVDVEPKLLEVIQERAEEKGLSNIIPITGVIEDIPLQDSMADVVIASLVLHAVRPLSHSLREIHRIMKNEGKLLCLDFEPKESPMGPPMNLRIASEDMTNALNAAGFTVTKRMYPSEFLYVFVAEKPGF